MIGSIVARTTVEANPTFVDPSAGVSVCAYREPDSGCSDVHVTNNLVGGAEYGGFVGAIGHKCYDTSSTIFKNNIAHSIIGTLSGAGAYINRLVSDPEQENCFEISDFKAYKCHNTPFITYSTGKKVVMSRMTFIDNKEGFTALLANKANEYEDLVIEGNDIKIMGETDSPDCPINGGFCDIYHKRGYITSAATWAGKMLHLTNTSPLPPQNIMSISSWGTKIVFNRLTF